MPASPKPAGGTDPRAGGSDLKVFVFVIFFVVHIWKYAVLDAFEDSHESGYLKSSHARVIYLHIA